MQAVGGLCTHAHGRTKEKERWQLTGNIASVHTFLFGFYFVFAVNGGLWLAIWVPWVPSCIAGVPLCRKTLSLGVAAGAK